MSKMTPLQATAPRKIWLQISDNADHHAEPFPREAEITWCEDSVTACQVGYVREDLAQPATMSTTEARAQHVAIIKALAELAQQPQIEDDIIARGPVMDRVLSIRAAADALFRAALAAAAPSPAVIVRHDELSRDPDGDIAIDYSNGVGMLTMSITPAGRLAWAVSSAVGSPRPTYDSGHAEVHPEFHPILAEALRVADAAPGAHPAPTAQPVAIPEGCKLVPVEMTDDMLHEAWRGLVGACDHVTIREAYRRMLRAAPMLNGLTASEGRHTFVCNKCGYCGPDATHARPHTGGQCNYMAGRARSVTASETAPDPSEPAPPNSLPNWDECAMRVANSNFIEKRIAEGGYGAEHDTKLASQLHRFIYEYDDSDPYRSAWFLHRLELLIVEARAAIASPARDAGLSLTKEAANWVRDGIANFVADNWPDRKHTLAEIEAGIRAIEINPRAAAQEKRNG
jgi:hypothetical protein